MRYLLKGWFYLKLSPSDVSVTKRPWKSSFSSLLFLFLKYSLEKALHFHICAFMYHGQTYETYGRKCMSIVEWNEMETIWFHHIFFLSLLTDLICRNSPSLRFLLLSISSIFRHVTNSSMCTSMRNFSHTQSLHTKWKAWQRNYANSCRRWMKKWKCSWKS